MSKMDEYKPCPNCDSRLKEAGYQSDHPQPEYDCNKFRQLFHEIYLHCPGTSPKAFGRFINEIITNYLFNYNSKPYLLPSDGYKRSQIFKSQGQLAELSKILSEVETREELTFLMWQSENVGLSPSDMDLYENYETLVYSRLDKLKEKPMPDTLKFLLTKHGIFRTRHVEDCIKIAMLNAKIMELETTNIQLHEQLKIGTPITSERMNELEKKADHVKAMVAELDKKVQDGETFNEQIAKLGRQNEQLRQLAKIYETALLKLRLEHEALLAEQKDNELGLIELATYIEEQNKTIDHQKRIIDLVQGVINE